MDYRSYSYCVYIVLKTVYVKHEKFFIYHKIFKSRFCKHLISYVYGPLTFKIDEDQYINFIYTMCCKEYDLLILLGFRYDTAFMVR